MKIYPIKATLSAFKNYCYLVQDPATKEAFLVDPAWEKEKIEFQINECLAKVKAILLTHHHLDHVNLAEYFARKYEIPVFLSKREKEEYLFKCYNLETLDNSNAKKIGSLTFIPLLTSGHTSGSLCYWIDQLLLTGDTLFSEGCGMCTGQGADPNNMFESLMHLKKIIPPDTRIYPGHSYGVEPGQPFSFMLKYNIYLSFEKREDFIKFRMRPNQQGLFAFK